MLKQSKTNSLILKKNFQNFLKQTFLTKNIKNKSLQKYTNCFSNNFPKKNSQQNFCTLEKYNPNEIERDEMETDVLIVGGGPSGLATAIRLQQLAKEKNKEIDVTLIDKGSDIGSHILSGNCLQIDSLNKLIPDWKEKGAPVEQEVSQDKFLILTENNSLSLPEFLLPKEIHNKGNYIISLSQLCSFLGQEAEEMGTNIFTGFAADKILYGEKDGKKTVEGVITGDFGINKNLEKKDTFEPGNILKAKITVLAEGCRGSISEKVMEEFNLRENDQHYGIGIKEVWEVPENHPNFKAGLVQHSINWPLDPKTYGGSFMYHQKPNLIHIGFVVALNYENPYLNPYEEFQKFKTHKDIKKYLEGGRCIGYGSRALNEGGYYSIPKLTFPGGLLVGCGAGFLNVVKIKGTHNAIFSGMNAAEAIFEELYNKENSENSEESEYGKELFSYQEKMKNSSVFKELYLSRNFHGAFSKGLWFGLIHGFFTNFILRGREFWSMKPTKKDSQYLKEAKNFKKIEYPKHDGKLTFDLLENLQRSGTNHDHDQPSHLRIKKDKLEAIRKSLELYDRPEERFCPAKVYEYVPDEKGELQLQINAQNCLHCKTCSIKMIEEYIDWNVPQGGEGPKYTFL